MRSNSNLFSVKHLIFIRDIDDANIIMYVITIPHYAGALFPGRAGNEVFSLALIDNFR